jgi:RHS repeat-associated protein
LAWRFTKRRTKDAPNRKIIAAPAATPEAKYWTTLIPEGSTPIEGASLVAGQLGVLSLQDVASVVRLYTLDGKLVRDVHAWTRRSQLVYTPLGGRLGFMSGQTYQKGRVPLVAGAWARYLASGLAVYRHPDWLGSVRLSSTPSQTVYYDGARAPYGEPYAEWGTNDHIFTGAYQDTVGDLYDFPFREYHPTQGRWLSPDPAGLAAADLTNPQSLNRYAYVLSNPASLVDPTGLFAPLPEGCRNLGTGPDGEPVIDCSGLWGGSAGAPSFEEPEGIGNGAGSSVGGGSPANNVATKPCTGFGIGLTASGTAAAGLVGTGAAATGSAGVGGFYGTGSGASVGGFASGGTVAYFGSQTVGAPTQPNDLSSRSVAGGFGGAGVGLMVTNAGSAQALKSTTTTWSFDLALEFGASIQVSSGGGIWALSVTLGPGYGLSFTQMNTATAAAGGRCH